MEPLIEIQSLTKRFGTLLAVDNVSFEIHRGEILGFLGPNGAGKSTTMKLVTGYLRPTAGTVRVCGFDVQASPLEVKRRIGYLPEGAPLYGEMTPTRFLEFAARIRRLDGKRRQVATDRMVDRLQLKDVLNQPIHTLSKGFKRRVGLAQALLLDPDVLILDEPTDGLDPNQKHEVRTILREIADRKAVIISTHILEEVEAVCTRAIVIAKGRVVADQRPDELAAQSDAHNTTVIRVVHDDRKRAIAAFRDLPGLTLTVRSADGAADCLLHLHAADRRDLRLPARETLAANGIVPLEFYRETGRLDEVFRAMTTTGGADGGESDGNER